MNQCRLADACCGHPGLRYARRTPRFAILAAHGFPTPARLGWGSPRAGSGWPMPSRRTLAAGILPFTRSWETALRHPGCARFPNAGSIGTGHPSRTRIPRADPIEAPRREPGGRRAVGRETSPEGRATLHHQHAQTAFRTKITRKLEPRAGGPLCPSSLRKPCRHLPPRASLRQVAPARGSVVVFRYSRGRFMADLAPVFAGSAGGRTPRAFRGAATAQMRGTSVDDKQPRPPGGEGQGRCGPPT